MLNTEWKTELHHTIEQLREPHQLEAFGKALSAEQMLYILDLMIHHKSDLNKKLNPILAGLSHEVFFEILPKLSNEQLLVLQHESITMPIQHHLTSLVIEKFKILDQLAALVLVLETMINSIEIEKMGIYDLKELLDKIDHLAYHVDQELTILNKALSLAWNSDRIDLIEKFSLLKESVQKYKISSIGNKKQKLENILIQPTGLYKLLEDKLNTVYADLNSINETGEKTLEVPAIEALAKLSIWYVHDYFQIGLLPEVESEKFLDLDPLTHSENERSLHREKLIAKVKLRLEELGLSTIEDLKKAHIYSKKALQEYIQLPPESEKK